MVSTGIPQADANNLRCEHRPCGADANPYLVTAAIVAGVHYGLKYKCDPGDMVEQGANIKPKLKVPNRWDTAIDKFELYKKLPLYLGKDSCKYFVINRRAESPQIHNTISALDFDGYLRSV